LSVLVGLVGLFAAGRAEAQTACQTDKDCPGTACGTQVCYQSSGLGTCVDPNTSGQSGLSDGWCVDTDGGVSDSYCKCAGMGATCNGLYCSFTIPPDGGAGGSTGGGGSTGSGGSTGTGGSGHAGTSGGSGGGGGCSVAGTPSLGGVAGLALLAVVLMRRRRRA
jgi:MYXO-CTERM domain-containing protein